MEGEKNIENQSSGLDLEQVRPQLDAIVPPNRELFLSSLENLPKFAALSRTRGDLGKLKDTITT